MVLHKTLTCAIAGAWAIAGVSMLDRAFPTHRIMEVAVAPPSFQYECLARDERQVLEKSWQMPAKLAIAWDSFFMVLADHSSPIGSWWTVPNHAVIHSKSAAPPAICFWAGRALVPQHGPALMTLVERGKASEAKTWECAAWYPPPTSAATNMEIRFIYFSDCLPSGTVRRAALYLASNGEGLDEKITKYYHAITDEVFVDVEMASAQAAARLGYLLREKKIFMHEKKVYMGNN